jgi:MoaA/NifB/PqqE/SkfB family radical SAM enzyme
MADIGGTDEVILIPVTIPYPVVDYIYPGDEAFQDMDDMRELGRELNLNLTIAHPPKEGQHKITHTTCKDPWFTVYITVEGCVTPCRFIPLPSKLNFGNIFEKHYSKLRNGKKYRQFRHRLKHCPEDPPVFCRNCPMLC